MILDTFLVEIWILYAIAVIFTGLRVLARARTVGWRGFQADDYLALGAILFYTAQIVVAYHGASLYYSTVGKDPSGPPPPPPEPNSPAMYIRARGSALHLTMWLLYPATLWLLKGSLTVLYFRLTTGLAGNYRFRTLLGFGLLIVSLVVVYLTVFLTCRPFSDNFDTVSPVVRNACIPAIARPIVWTCYSLNVLTDIYLLALPIPMLFHSTLKLWKKIGLGFLFSGGLAVIMCATIRCVLLTTDPKTGAPVSGNWAIREAFVAVITTNFPVVFSLVKGMLGPAFSSRGTSDPSKLKDSSGHEMGTNLGSKGGSESARRTGKGREGASKMTTTQMLLSESEENILKGNGDDVGLSPLSGPTASNHGQLEAGPVEYDAERAAPRDTTAG